MGLLWKLLTGYSVIWAFIDHMSHGADENYIKSSLTNHFADTRHHIANPGYKEQARKFLYTEFTKFGLETNFHNFTQYQAEFANIIGVLKGDRYGTIDDKIVAVGAHYDTVEITKGVDDNGSGCAALLEVARQMWEQGNSGIRRKNTIMFFAFDYEEYTGDDFGPWGSKYLIEQWLTTRYDSDTLARTHGIIVMDTVMYYNQSANSQVIPPEYLPIFNEIFPHIVESVSSDSFQGDFLATTFRTGPDGSLAAAFINSWNSQGRPQYEIELFSLPITDLNKLQATPEKWNAFSNFFRSDHYRFWQHQIPALFVSDSANFRGKMIECYHHPCDELSNILTDENVRFLDKIADTIAATVDQLAESFTTDTCISGGDRLAKVSHILVWVLGFAVSTEY